MIIFALSAIVLFALMGLAVDAGISYLHSDQQERAAEAAALSGVTYLPGDFTDAQREALLTAQRNGYTNTSGGPPTSAVTVTVWQPASTTNELEVSITAPAPVYFLDLVGFRQHEVTSYAVAEYLPPIQMGQPGNTLGTTEPNVGTAGYYFLRTEGYGNPRSEGDAFTPSPTESSTNCNGVCTASPADVHQISCIAGDDTCSGDHAGLEANDTGGYNYLIYVPAGTAADVQVYNPSFDPGTDSNGDIDSYHDDDSSFPTLAAGVEPPATDYASMGFTLYAVPALNNRSADIPLKQDIFCPFNAFGLEPGNSYTYYKNCNSPSAAVPSGVTSVTGITPTVFHSWVSLLSYDPVAGSGSSNQTKDDAALFNPSYNNLGSESSYLTNVSGTEYLSGGSAGQYFRLRVDTLAWNGSPINTSNSAPSPTVDSATLPDSYPLAHNAYALQVVVPGTGSCAGCTVSAMADLCIYTPLQNGSYFQVPLFDLPSEYAGKLIAVRVFDPGDVGNGAAYLGIIEPTYTAGSTTYPTGFATLATGSDGSPAVYNIGNSLGAGGLSAITPYDGTSPGYTFQSTSAVVQTAGSDGGSLYNGQWVQFDIQVPKDYNATGSGAYWSLFYQVAPGTTAGDTITVQVQYLGSPVHLLPNS
jgi:hypothetical protein